MRSRSKRRAYFLHLPISIGHLKDIPLTLPHFTQHSLLEHQLCGVLPTSMDGFALGRGLENSLPLEVVRGAMTIRVNSLTRGHSAVRIVVLEALTNFLNHGITPIVPLRGTISASGDLSPLSYIAASITGHPDSKVHVDGKIMSAQEAIALKGLQPVVLGPKEGLGLVNGTAVSASMATLALTDAHVLSLLAQALTALTVEAMVGHAGSFHPFLHDVTRPHPTQIEVARNIRTLLEGSKYAVHHETEVKVKDDEGILRQDRYPLRCSPQVRLLFPPGRALRLIRAKLTPALVRAHSGSVPLSAT
jgi:phenylalanine ammonia-lyase